jgi:hypothetical protein
MNPRADLQREIERLESRMPSLTRDMDTFFRKFEDESDRLAASSSAGDHEWLMDELLRMVRSYGIASAQPQR